MVSIRKVGKGKTEPLDISDRVTQMTFEDTEKKADKLTLTIDNFDLTTFDSSLFQQGNVIEFTWGYAGVYAPVRSAIIKKTKGGAVVNVEAYEKSVLMNRDTRSRVWENMKRSDVAREIARENGFSSDDVLQIDDTKIVFPFISQARMTDAQFLRHLANKEGFEWFVDFEGFHFHERRLDQKPIKKFIYYTDPDAGDIIGIPTVEETSVAKRGRVRVQGRNPMEKTTHDVAADESTETNKVEATKLISVGGQGLVKVTAYSPGAPAANVANEEVLPTSQTDEAAATREAQGRYKRSRVNSVKVNFNAIGDPLMVGKSMFELEGIGEAYSGLYYAEKVRHTLGSGYTMTIEGKRSGRRSGAGVPNAGKANTETAQTDAEKNKKGQELEPVLVDVPGQGLVTQYRNKSGRGKGKQ